jgi:hypothetical protein
VIPEIYLSLFRTIGAIGEGALRESFDAVLPLNDSERDIVIKTWVKAVVNEVGPTLGALFSNPHEAINSVQPSFRSLGLVSGIGEICRSCCTTCVEQDKNIRI